MNEDNRRFRITHGGYVDRPLLVNLTAEEVVKFALAIPSQFICELRVNEDAIRRLLPSADSKSVLGLNGGFEVGIDIHAKIKKG